MRRDRPVLAGFVPRRRGLGLWLAALALSALAFSAQAGHTTTTLASSANPSVVGQSVTFTATVTGSFPTGTVTFRDGATVLGTVALNGSGIATLSTSVLAVGSHSVTAVYSGDANNSASTSPSLIQVVNKASTTTTLTTSPNPSLFGQVVTFTATVSAIAPGGGRLRGRHGSRGGGSDGERDFQ
jgi:hypothetical protein